MLKYIVIFLKHQRDYNIHILSNLLYLLDALSWRSFHVSTYTSASFFLTAAYYPIECALVYPFPRRNVGCLNFLLLKITLQKSWDRLPIKRLLFIIMYQCLIPHTLAIQWVKTVLHFPESG